VNANTGHSPAAWRTGQIDPKLSFLVGSAYGRNAQIAVAPQLRGERVESTLNKPCRWIAEWATACRFCSVQIDWQDCERSPSERLFPAQKARDSRIASLQACHSRLAK
jgi:hypothetical protein